MKHERIAARHQRLLVALMIVLTQASALGLDTSGITGTVPFHVHEHLIIMKGTIGELNELNLALDTGSTFTVLSQKVGKELRLEGETVKVSAFGREVKMERVSLDRLGLGDIKFEEVDARLTDLPAVDGLRLDGLIGLDLLKRSTTITLDFEKGELVFGHARELPRNTRFYAGLNFIPVTMRVEGKALRLTLDTAACGLVLYGGAAMNGVEIHRTNRIEIRGQVGGRVEMEEVLLSDVSLGESLWDKVPAFLMVKQRSGNENVMGNLGVVSLGFKILQFEFETGQLGWEF